MLWLNLVRAAVALFFFYFLSCMCVWEWEREVMRHSLEPPAVSRLAASRNTVSRITSLSTDTLSWTVTSLYKKQLIKEIAARCVKVSAAFFSNLWLYLDKRNHLLPSISTLLRTAIKSYTNFMIESQFVLGKILVNMLIAWHWRSLQIPSSCASNCDSFCLFNRIWVGLA